MKTHLLQLKTSNFIEHKAIDHLWVVDWDGKYKTKNQIPQGQGGCKAYTFPVTLKDGATPAASVEVGMSYSMDVTSFGFAKSVWKKQGIGQCDAVIFPTQDKEDDAILFIETKYSESTNNLQSYKEKAKKQITDTIEQLKKVGCPLDAHNLYGLVSFPMMAIGSAVLFSTAELMEIFNSHNVELMVGNNVLFESESSIRLNTP